MQFWDSAITCLIVVLAAIFLVKCFLGGKGCPGGCHGDRGHGSDVAIKDMRSDTRKNKNECSACSYKGE